MSGGLARTACAIVLTAGLTGYGSEAAEIRVSSQSTLDQALAVANPGDEIVIEDGSYRDLNMEVDRSGTAVAPIVLRAQTAGKVILGGSSRLRLIGDHVTIRGFCFRDGRASGEIWQLAGSHQRITECALIDY